MHLSRNFKYLSKKKKFFKPQSQTFQFLQQHFNSYSITSNNFHITLATAVLVGVNDTITPFTLAQLCDEVILVEEANSGPATGRTDVLMMARQKVK
jgi:hypothetical protein